MGQLVLDGSISIGPAGGGNVFPASLSSVPLSSTPTPKSSAVDTGYVIRTINSPSSFITLSGIGATDTVTQCDTLHFRCQAAMQLRITYSATPSDIVAINVVMGTILIEAPPASNQPAPNYIKLVEVMGAGQIEYLGSGLA